MKSGGLEKGTLLVPQLLPAKLIRVSSLIFNSTSFEIRLFGWGAFYWESVKGTVPLNFCFAPIHFFGLEIV